MRLARRCALPEDNRLEALNSRAPQLTDNYLLGMATASSG